MAELSTHWTEKSADEFLYRIASDYVRQIEDAMIASQITQVKMAETLGVSEGRVSQVMNNPGNLTLKKIIQYARALGKKVAIVAYDDDDPLNEKGPINSVIFASCWETAGKPSDFFELDEKTSAGAANVRTAAPNYTHCQGTTELTLSYPVTFIKKAVNKSHCTERNTVYQWPQQIASSSSTLK